MPRRKNKGPDDRLTKAGFVRSLPADTPPKEVAEKAKEAGLSLSAKNVSTIRAKDRARGKGPSKAAAPKKRGAKKKAARTGITKTAYVMSLPLTLSAREVVAEAKANGMVLTEKHVSVIRSVAKKKNLLQSSKKKAPGAERISVRVPKHAGRLSPEDLLGAAVLAVGLPRATALVAEENRKLHLLLAG